jgi:demethylmenaquinone methyltransferase/2-methoxy-6-polyprenyl-1,4-benzoquinol methylase
VTALNQENKDIRGLSLETWKKAVKAIEDSIPLYDRVNHLISLGKAQEARNFALGRLELNDGVCALDSGIGPGTTSGLILSTAKPSLLVGLDASTKQLKTARENLAHHQTDAFHVVRGSFEFLPFRGRTFDVIITCYALRDSLEISRSLAEYSRVCSSRGSFADVDIGKPENALKRAGSTVYIKFIMPFMAKIAILGRLKGNPWRMIAPTYKSLPTNGMMLTEVRRQFQQVEFKEFLMGGVIIMIGRKPVKLE